MGGSPDSDAINVMADNDMQGASNVPKQRKRFSSTMVILKMIFLGIFLPAFDLGTDLLAIYQYWISNQWVLNVLASGLIFSLLGHNLASALYGWKNWASLSSAGAANDMMNSLAWKVVQVVLFVLGLGNIPTTIELIVEFAFQRKMNLR